MTVRCAQGHASDTYRWYRPAAAGKPDEPSAVTRPRNPLAARSNFPALLAISASRTHAPSISLPMSLLAAARRRNNPALETRDIYAEARIFVRADQSTAYGNVVDVMSQLQEAGFVKVGIFAELASEG